ncbi:MAG: hypothetical protein IPL26_17875 [Leptospiraceae bacterium]|nr:hypothetical protein [Leptospiraceae bacterium]
MPQRHGGTESCVVRFANANCFWIGGCMSYWGKTDKDEAGQISLPYHMLDVAAVAVEDD